MNVPVNFLHEDLLDNLRFNVSVEFLKGKGYKYVYIITNTPKAFPENLIHDCDDLLYDLDSIKQEDFCKSAFYIYFSRGDYALPFLEKILENGGAIVCPEVYWQVPFWQNNKYCIDIYNEVGYRLQAQPKGSIQELASIMQAVEATRNIEGDYVEIGVFTGTSALSALSYMERIGVRRTCYLLDTYSGFNYEEAFKSQDIKWENTHGEWAGVKFDGKGAVKRIKHLTEYSSCNVVPLEFNVCRDALPKDISKIAMANLDVDMYEAVFMGLCKLAPLMAKHGIITIEDPCYTHGIYGAYYALNKFLNSEDGKKFMCLRSESTYFLIKTED